MSRRKALTPEQIGLAKADYAAKNGPSLQQLADRFGVSKSTMKRAVAPEHMAIPKDGNFKEFGVSGLNRFGGSVQEDYLRDWNTLGQMVPTVKRMLDHPTISAIIFAVEMTVRAAQWTVTPASEDQADLDAAEFLEGCIEDMSMTWDDHIVQAMSMIGYGFAPFEIVYKRRLGPDKDPASSYDDGTIGWRKFAYRSPDSLSPGDEWVFDENGGVQGLNQSAPPTYQKLTIPMEKMLLYRTTSAKNNPQGRSALRGAYIPWYFSKNLSEVEGIAAERMGTGIPVIYLGGGTTAVGDNSDFAKAQDIVRNMRADEQAGIVFDKPKQTSDGKGILFELVAPPSRGIIDFNQIIERYNQQIAQTLLAQFIFLGLSERGTQALAVRATDFFTEALTGWLESIGQVLNRFAVPRLFRLNAAQFPNITGYPEIVAGPIGQMDVAKVVEATTKAAQAGLIRGDAGIERTLRQVLELPDMEEGQQEDAIQEEETQEDTEGEPELGGEGETPEDIEGEPDLGEEESSDLFFNLKHDVKTGQFAPDGGGGGGGGGGDGGGGGGGGEGGEGGASSDAIGGGKIAASAWKHQAISRGESGEWNATKGNRRANVRSPENSTSGDRQKRKWKVQVKHEGNMYVEHTNVSGFYISKRAAFGAANQFLSGQGNWIPYQQALGEIRGATLPEQHSWLSRIPENIEGEPDLGEEESPETTAALERLAARAEMALEFLEQSSSEQYTHVHNEPAKVESNISPPNITNMPSPNTTTDRPNGT